MSRRLPVGFGGRRWRAEPPPRLRTVVLSCAGFEIRGTAGRVRREVPVPRVPLIITLEGRVELREAKGTRALSSFVAGPDDGPTLTDLGTRWVGLQVDLSPPAAAALLGAPLSELARRVVPLEDVLGPAANRVVERLGNEPDWGRRVHLLEDFLSARLGAAREVPAQVCSAWSLLVAHRGRVDIRDVARRVGWSRQHLSSRFADELGLPPKRFARVIRFDHAVSLARRPRPDDWTRIALRSGYFDQAHFVNEFRDLAGCTPTRFKAVEFPGDPARSGGEATFVQDTGARTVHPGPDLVHLDPEPWEQP